MPPKKEGSKSTLNSTKKGGKSKASDASSASAAPAVAPVTNPSPTSATASPATTATTSPVSPASATAIEIASAQPVADKKTSEAGAYPHVPKVLRNTTVGQSYEKLYESTTLHPKKPDPVSVFGLTTTDLKECVDFDERNSKELVDRLNSARFGGVEGVARALKVDLELGLVSGTPSAEALSSPASDASAKKAKKKTGTAQAEVPAFVDKLAFGRERFRTFGQNLVPPPASENVFQIILGTIKGDALIKILLAGALIVLIAGSVKDPKEGWIDGMAILVAVIIVLTVTAWNDWSKDKKFKKLLTLQSDKKAKVIRDGKQLLISSWDVLVGDLIELLPGDEVAADGIFVRGLNLSIDESPLVGLGWTLKASASRQMILLTQRDNTDWRDNSASQVREIAFPLFRMHSK